MSLRLMRSGEILPKGLRVNNPWKILERYSDPELIKLSKKLDTELSEEELKVAEEWKNNFENLRVKSFITLPAFGLIGLALNLGAIIIPFELPQYPIYTLTYTTAVLCWDIAVIVVFHPGVLKRFIRLVIRLVEAVMEVRKPILLLYFNRYTLVIPSVGFLLLVFSFVKPKYILYKNTIIAISNVIIIHATIFTPFMTYLIFKLTRTPVLVPYCSAGAIPKHCHFKISYATKKLWKTAEGYKPLVFIRLFSTALIVVVINTLLLILLTKLLGIKHTPHDVEIFSRVAPVVTLGATPALTIVLRNLLYKIPLKRWIDTILGVINIVVITVFCIPFISGIIIYYRLV